MASRVRQSRSSMSSATFCSCLQATQWALRLTRPDRQLNQPHSKQGWDSANFVLLGQIAVMRPLRRT
jgi:hypothetical protein